MNPEKKTLSVRVSEEECRQARLMARAAGLGISDYISLLIRTAPEQAIFLPGEWKGREITDTP